MDYYYLTEKFTLIPKMFFSQKNAIEAIKELYGVDKGEVIKHIYLQSFDAYLAYILPIATVSRMKEGEEIYPFAYALMDSLKNVTEYNKVLFHYSVSHHLAHVVIAKGEELQLVNSYHADCFESAVYYLFLAVKQTIINPLQTTLHIYSPLSPEELQIISKYFSGIEADNIESKTNLL